jgi:hypothetical protein
MRSEEAREDGVLFRARRGGGRAARWVPLGAGPGASSVWLARLVAGNFSDDIDGVPSHDIFRLLIRPPNNPGNA